jgi:hypothetical protein
MSTCPPKRNLPPPRKSDGTIIMQPNRAFDTEAEMKSFLAIYHPEMIRVHKVWKVEVIRCEIVVPECKAK